MATDRPRGVMGIDPGVRGGVAVLSDVGSVVRLRGFKPTMTEKELIDEMGEALTMLEIYEGNVCFMEKVGAFPKDSRKGAFTFGKVYGLMRGALLSYSIQIVDVYPQVWQAKMGCLTGGNKNVSKRRAAQLFPSHKMTHAVADALLIAAYGRLFRRV